MSVRSLPRRWRRPGGSGGEFLRDRIYHPYGNEIWADEFDDGTIDPGWVRTDAASSSYVTWAEAGTPGVGSMSAHHTANGSGDAKWHALSYPLPAGATHPLTFETYWSGMTRWEVNHCMVGLAFTDGTSQSSTNQATAFGYMSTNTEGAIDTNLRDFDNWNTNPTTWTQGIWGNFSRGMYLQIQYTAANSFRMRWGFDSFTWHTSATQTITCTPTHMSLIHTNWSGTHAYTATWQYARLYDTLTPEEGTVTTIT